MQKHKSLFKISILVLFLLTSQVVFSADCMCGGDIGIGFHNFRVEGYSSKLCLENGMLPNTRIVFNNFALNLPVPPDILPLIILLIAGSLGWLGFRGVKYCISLGNELYF